MTHIESVVRPAIAELHRIGTLPTDDEADRDPRRLELWQDSLDRIYAEGGITDTEAATLLACFPSDATDGFGTAWTLVHIVESASGWPLDDVLADASGPWVELLQVRSRQNVRHSPRAEQPAPQDAQHAAILTVTNLLADGDAETLARMTRARMFTAEQLRETLATIGRIEPLSQESMNEIEITEVVRSGSRTVSVTIPLLTRNDHARHSLELELAEKPTATYDITIINIS